MEALTRVDTQRNLPTAEPTASGRLFCVGFVVSFTLLIASFATKNPNPIIVSIFAATGIPVLVVLLGYLVVGETLVETPLQYKVFSFVSGYGIGILVPAGIFLALVFCGLGFLFGIPS